MFKTTVFPIIALTVAVFVLSPSPVISSSYADTEYFKIGWVSALTGPISKYAAHESAELAVEDINKAGGVLGRPLKLIMEDGRCDAVATISATKKLIDINKVDYILGGHCSTETLALAPIAQANKIVTVASITSSPDVSHMGDYIFRTSSTTQNTSSLAAKYIKKQNYDRIAVIYEDTDYAASAAEILSKEFKKLGGEVVLEESFFTETNNLRSLLLKTKNRKPDALYISVQAQDKGALLLRQLNELAIHLPMIGNESFGNTPNVIPGLDKAANGIVFVETKFETNSPIAQDFVSRYTKKFNRTSLPYGIWNADAYDGVLILADAINRCGPDKEKVRGCLSNLKDYHGASGTISFDENGDAIREYVLKQIQNGKVVEIAK